MPDSHTVVAGDTLWKIAKDHGYSSWREVYFHDVNKEFREKIRTNPHHIRPGDVVHLPPKKKTPQVEGGTARISMTLPWNFAKRLKIGTQIPLYPIPLSQVTPNAGKGPLPAKKSTKPAGPPISPDPDPATTKPWEDPLRQPKCVGIRPPVPLPPPPLTDDGKTPGERALSALGSALWECREVQEPILDALWYKAPGWRKGLEVGLFVTSLTTLIVIDSTRDDTLNFFEGIPIPVGKAYPDDWAGARWIRPIKPSIIWNDQEGRGQERGFFLLYDLSGEFLEFR